MTLKVAVFGAGWFGKKHAGILSQLDGAEICGFCSPRLQQANEAASRYGAKGYDNITAMLVECKPDAAVIAVPPYAHGEIENSLIDRRIPFLVEKPIGMDPRIVNEINTRIQDTGLTTSVGYHFRYTDAAAKAKEWLRGRTVVMAYGRWLGDTPDVRWWKDERLSGGQMMEQTTHMADLVRYLCGEALEVSASFGHVHTDPNSEDWNVSDSGAATVRLANGSVAVLANSCALESNYDVGLDIFAERGRLSIGFEGITIAEDEETTKISNRQDPYWNEINAFLHAVRTGDTSMILSDYADAVKSFQLTWAAREAARTGKSQRL